MTTLYRYYQLIGGTETWTPVRANEDLAPIKPTFETILALDTLLESDPDQDTKDRIKYLGPLYFDIDAKDDIAGAIESAQELLEKLTKAGLTQHDIEIYASGKKGFHLIVPTTCFMEKPDEPIARLPAIYKEMAFKFAVPFIDFSVYTAKRGRMLRTVYNQRENGLYKVALTAQQLADMTPELYEELASKPSGKAQTRPCFNPRFSMAYVAACQKVTSYKLRRPKPATPDILRRDLTIVNKLLRGECSQGFNKIAIQLAIYAREVGWNEDQLVEAAQELVSSHESDGYRYNTPAKRIAELRRMVHYVDDNGGYTYSSVVLRNMVAVAPPIAAPTRAPEPVLVAADANAEAGEVEVGDSAPDPAEDAPAEPENIAVSEFMALRVSLEGIFADNGEKVQQLSNASIGNLSVAHIVNGEVASIQADIYVNGLLVQRGCNLPTDAFTGSASLHRELIRFGSGFYGSDMQARAVLGALHVTGAQAVIALNHAGLDLVKLPNSPHKALRDGVLVWTGEGGSKAQAWAKDLANFTFSAEESHQTVSDLMNAPHPAEYFVTDEAKEELRIMWRSLWTSNHETTIGLLYGWMTACFYRPLIHAATQQFPSLHVAGAAGYGKTANVKLAMSLHTFQNELPETTPNSTPYALSQLLSGYSSTPILLDEYKPHRMSEQKLEGFRALIRDLYNGKSALRGGGGGRTGGGAAAGSWKNLSTTNMKAPMIFVAEALETETAISERSVPVTVTKRRGAYRTFEAFNRVKERRHLLSTLGRGIVEAILMRETVSSVAENLRALSKSVGAELRAERPTDTVDLARARRNINERPLHNTCVVLFGLERLWSAVGSILGDEVMKEFEEIRCNAIQGIKDALVESSCTTMPEMIKFLLDLNDMLRTAQGRMDGVPTTQLVEKDGEVYLAVRVRATYSDYRSWCRQRNMPLYYANAESVMHALRHFDGYSVKESTTETMFIEWTSLLEAGMGSWYTKPIKWKY